MIVNEPILSTKKDHSLPAPGDINHNCIRRKDEGTERLLKRLSMFLLCFMYLTGGGNGAITVAASETEKAQGKILTAEDFPPEVLEEAAAPPESTTK